MRILKYAFHNIVRNPFLSISSLFVLTLLIFFVNILLGVLFISDRFVWSVNDRISFTISFQSGYTVSDIEVRSLADALQTAFTGIAIEPISKREAFAILKERNPDLTALIENSGENPLPDSLRIDNIPLDQYARFNDIISEYKTLLFYDRDALNRQYLDYQSQFQRVSVVVRFLHMIELWVYGLLLLFFFTVSVTVYTTISNFIFFHRDEIEVIELVGGSRSFLYGPFILQWVFYALFSVALALSLIFLLSSALPIEFKTGPLANIHSDIDMRLMLIAPYQFLVFFFLSLIASIFALRSHIK